MILVSQLIRNSQARGQKWPSCLRDGSFDMVKTFRGHSHGVEMIKKNIAILILLTLANLLYPEDVLELNLEKIFEIGQEKIFFESITAVYEDEIENIYVLDEKAYKVYKLSSEGTLHLFFGNRGQGPGDFISPHSLLVTSDGNIIVNDSRDYVSVFDKQGKFLNRIKVSMGLDLNFLNYNLFYGWVWTRKGKQQVLLDNNGKIKQSFFSVSKEDFSISLPDETGRMGMFNCFMNEYTPFLLFSRYKNYCIIGVTDKYEILILNQEGKIIKKICREIKPGIISPKEKEYFINQINNNSNLPDFVRKKFIRRIPRYKNYFNHILISDPYIWVFRIIENVLEQDTHIKVDIFNIGSKFIGTLTVKDLPLFISAKYIYFEETNIQEDLLISKYKYDIRKTGRQ